MFDSFWRSLFEVMSVVSGQPISSDFELKARLLLYAGVFLVIFCTAFFFFYRKHFWHEAESRRLFFWTALLLAIVVLGKFAVSFIAKGYVPDRIFFYGLPSPKFGGILWLLPIFASLFAIIRFRVRALSWPTWKFLLLLWFAFSLFSVGVAGIREGSFGVYEPFSRNKLEYSGYLPHIQTLASFFGEYTATVSDEERTFADHAKTHPPGYVLILYTFQEVFRANLLGMAVLTVLVGGMFIFPVFYFWRQFISEERLRSALSVIIFIPSLVMFSATSMDIMTPLFFWLALFISFLGWKKGRLLSLLGGVLAGLALLMNFLFLAFGLVFLFFLMFLFKNTAKEQQKMLLQRTLWSTVGLVGFFGVLQMMTGYSIIENFFAAQSVHSGVVTAGASSVLVHLLFALINVFAFFLYFGIPNVLLLFGQGWKYIVLREHLLSALPFGILFIFVLSGLFQGEIERIWLFLIPLFIPILDRAMTQVKIERLGIISLLIFQVVIMQTLFFTYW